MMASINFAKKISISFVLLVSFTMSSVAQTKSTSPENSIKINETLPRTASNLSEPLAADANKEGIHAPH